MESMRRIPRWLVWGLLVFWAGVAPVRAGLRVVTLHPVLTELAERVGGGEVQVTALVGPGKDPHHFSPSPGDVKVMLGSNVVLASGKHLENYLEKLRSNLAGGPELVEVGRTIPSLKVTADDPMFLCCPEHAHGAIDPHWWNSVENMQRAGRVVADAFGRADPANAKVYRRNAQEWERELAALKSWAKREIGAIPRERRKLATSHLALSYFAKEFGFRLLPVQGLNPHAAVSSRDLAAAVDTIRREGVVAVFPEKGVNPKVLRELTRETGVRLGGELIGDGNGTGALSKFSAAFRHNVSEIVKALR